MKKCKDCEREVDKYMIACEYCGKLIKHEEEMGNKEQEKKSEESDEEKA